MQKTPSSVKRYGNVFLIETPLQLINAMEAVEHFKMFHNHLIIILGVGYPADAYSQLIQDGHWESVQYIPFFGRHVVFMQRFLGVCFSRQIERVINLYREYRNRARFDKVAAELSPAENVILGNYVEEWKQHMRHFANSLHYVGNLYLIDDGTDMLRVNEERKLSMAKARPGSNASDTLGRTSIRRKLRRRFLDLDNREAKNLIFFSAFDLKARQGDRLVRNEYEKLRGLAEKAVQSNVVYFLGQCVIEDKIVEEEAYFRYLKEIKGHFSGRELYYIPHPRESNETLWYVTNVLEWSIKRTNGPIEYYIATSGQIPKVLASFFCSALFNCSVIYGGHLEIMAFYIEPKHVCGYSEFVRGVYEYIKLKVNHNIELVELNLAKT